MSRELPNWLDEYETKRTDLEKVMNAATVCTRRAWIREKIRKLEELYDKVIYNFPKCVCLLSIKAILVSKLILKSVTRLNEFQIISSNLHSLI